MPALGEEKSHVYRALADYDGVGIGDSPPVDVHDEVPPAARPASVRWMLRANLSCGARVPSASRTAIRTRSRIRNGVASAKAPEPPTATAWRSSGTFTRIMPQRFSAASRTCLPPEPN